MIKQHIPHATYAGRIRPQVDARPHAFAVIIRLAAIGITLAANIAIYRALYLAFFG